MGISFPKLLSFIYNGGDSLTLLEHILILSNKKGMAVIAHAGGHIHNLGFMFYLFEPQ